MYLTKPIFYGASIIYLLIIIGLCRFFKFNLFSFKPLSYREISIIIISLLFVEISTFILTSFINIPNNENGLNKIVNQSNLFISIITICLFIPIIEECIFRGILIKVMFQKNQWIGVLISIILFTMAHGPTNIIEYVLYGIPSVIYSITYYKTQRLEIPIIIHIINNSLSFII